MTLPNFLGIGAARSGTTWLDKILRSHSDIYLPERRKEINFFDWYYDRGVTWYEKFFPSPSQALKYRSIGEITSQYIFAPQAPVRIKKHLPDCRFIVNLRNPVDRAYSNYAFLVRDCAEQRTFQECLVDQRLGIVSRGLYSQQLKRYLQLFPRENFFFIIYEDIIVHPKELLFQLAQFLSVDGNKFDLNIIKQKVNASRKSRFPLARALVIRYREYLRRKNLDWVWNIAKNSGMKQIFEVWERGAAVPPIETSIRAELFLKYESDIAALEELIGIDLSIWRGY